LDLRNSVSYPANELDRSELAGRAID
jgi:hypothetical protein